MLALDSGGFDEHQVAGLEVAPGGSRRAPVDPGANNGDPVSCDLVGEEFIVGPGALLLAEVIGDGAVTGESIDVLLGGCLRCFRARGQALEDSELWRLAA